MCLDLSVVYRCLLIGYPFLLNPSERFNWEVKLGIKLRECVSGEWYVANGFSNDTLRGVGEC